MNQNRLIINQVAGDNIVEYELDLYDNVSIPINKSIIDIQNIAERKSDFSKTITLPGTSNNNNIFSNIFNLARSVQNDETYNFAPDFNPSLKADAILYKNGIVQLQGYLQLTNINVLDDYEIEYEIIIIGRTANLFQDLGEKKLSELNLSAFNHVWNLANISASWSAPIGVGYYYGLIEYGASANEITHYIDQLQPQIYLKTIIQAIFDDAGYRFNSDFFNTTTFKSLVVPSIGKKLLLSDGDVAARLFLGNRITNSGLTAMTSSVAKMPFNNEVRDTSPPNGFNAATFDFTSRASGRYRFASNIIIDLKNTSGVNQFYAININFLRNGTRFSSQSLYLGTINAGATISITKLFFTSFIFVNLLDVIEVELEAANYYDLEYNLKTDSNFYDEASAEILENDIIELEKLLPDDIKQTDFLSSVFKTFNLYVEPDILDDKKLIIEPRDTFYTNTLVDFTNLVDVSKPIKIEPMGALRYKEYKYSFDKDTDENNTLYGEKYIEQYGTKKQDIVNDFVTDQSETKVIFAPSPLSQSDFNDRILTRIFFLNNGNIVSKPSKLRLLYRGGNVATANTWNITSRVSGTVTNYNIFPYVGHLDSVSSPNFDINFDIPKQLFYDATVYTDGNLFNIYHRKGLEEITNADSKVVTFSIKISELGINQLSFRYYYLIDKQYYRLYEIDFDSNSEEPAVLTFLKLNVAPEFITTTQAINGGIGDIGRDANPIFDQRSIRNENQYNYLVDNIVNGYENTIQGSTQLINSDRNLINANKVSVLGGENNTLIRNGATYLGCNNYQSVRDGEVVVNNIDQPLLASRVLTVSELQNLHTTPIELLAAVDGYWTEIYDAYITMFFEAATPVAYNNHKLHLQYSGDGTHLLEFDNRITTVTTATKQRGVNINDLPFKNLAVQIHTAGNLGTSGNGKALIELEYRLHRIIQ